MVNQKIVDRNVRKVLGDIFDIARTIQHGENAQPAEAEPVHRGQWESLKRPGGALYCSECKSVSPWSARHNYCPNCGAKMDADDRDQEKADDGAEV